MDGEHIFSATIVLVMVCAAFPSTPANTMAMNAGLGLLRTMGERGNTHMGVRHELLVHLRDSLAHQQQHDHHRHRRHHHHGVRQHEDDLGGPPRQQQQPPHHGTPPAPVDGAGPATTPPLAYVPATAGAAPSQQPQPAAVTFPAVDNRALGEPFYDESVTTGMDFGLWEEGFAYPTMDLDFDLAQRTAANVQLSGFIH